MDYKVRNLGLFKLFKDLVAFLWKSGFQIFSSTCFCRGQQKCYKYKVNCYSLQIKNDQKVVFSCCCPDHGQK